MTDKSAFSTVYKKKFCVVGSSTLLIRKVHFPFAITDLINKCVSNFSVRKNKSTFYLHDL